MDITIEDIPSQMVLGMRRKGRYQEIAKMIPEVCQYAIEKGVQITGPPIFVCHETKPEEVMKADQEGSANVEIAVPVSSRVPDTDEIFYHELPGGKMAKTIHKGPYEECGPTYEELFKWITENGKTIAGPLREIYLNDPKEVKPEDILTVIYAPIR